MGPAQVLNDDPVWIDAANDDNLFVEPLEKKVINNYSGSMGSGSMGIGSFDEYKKAAKAKKWAVKSEVGYFDIPKSATISLKPITMQGYDVPAEVAEEIKKYIEVKDIKSKTRVWVVVTDVTTTTNRSFNVPCKSYRPIGNVAYSSGNLNLMGVEHFDLGDIDFSYKVTISDCNWEVVIPLPLEIIKNNINAESRKILETLIKKYKSDKYRITYVQLVGVK